MPACLAVCAVCCAESLDLPDIQMTYVALEPFKSYTNLTAKVGGKGHGGWGGLVVGGASVVVAWSAA